MKLRMGRERLRATDILMAESKESLPASFRMGAKQRRRVDELVASRRFRYRTDSDFFRHAALFLLDALAAEEPELRTVVDAFIYNQRLRDGEMEKGEYLDILERIQNQAARLSPTDARSLLLRHRQSISNLAESEPRNWCLAELNKLLEGALQA